LEVITHAHQLGNIASQPIEIRDYGRRELHGPFFPVDVRTMSLAYKPVGAAVNPGIQSKSSHRLHRGFDDVGLQHALFDHGKIRPDEESSIKGSNRRGERQRLDQHLHAARGPATGNCEFDPRNPQLADSGTRAFGEHLLSRYKRAINVGYNETN